MASPVKEVKIEKLPDLMRGNLPTFTRITEGNAKEAVVVDPGRLPVLMPHSELTPLASLDLPAGSKISLVVKIGNSNYGISLGGAEEPKEPLQASNPTSEEFFYRFRRGALTQRESRSLDSVSLLETILTEPNPEQMAGQLSVTDRNHTRLVSQDFLSKVLERHPGREDELISAYEKFAYPMVKKLFEEISNPSGSRVSMPFAFYNGLQGRVNGRLMMRYIIEERNKVSFEYLRDHACSGEFDSLYFQKAGIEGMMVSVYGNSPSEAMIDYLTHHRDERYRKTFAGLRDYHFPNVNNQWTVGGDGTEKMGEGWVYDAKKGVWKNKGKARIAVGELVDILIGNPEGAPMKLEDYLQKTERVVRTITNDIMDFTPSRHGGHFGGGFRMSVYDGHNDEAVTDFLKNHYNPEVRRHFKDLREYHFSMGARWRLPDGSRNLELARDAIGELTSVLARKNGIRIDEIPQKISQDLAQDTKIKYGANLGGMFSIVYGSHVLGYIDFLKNHPDKTLREVFSGMDVYHFANPPKGTWTSREPKEGDGWIKTGSDDNPVWRNVGLAHKAFSELVEVLTDPQGQYKWSLLDVFRKTTLSVMRETKIKYNATCSQALSSVYGDLIDLALGEYVTSDSFRRLVDGRSYLSSQIRRKGILAFREEVFSLERGYSGVARPAGYPKFSDAYMRESRELWRLSPEEIRKMQIEEGRKMSRSDEG